MDDRRAAAGDRPLAIGGRQSAIVDRRSLLVASGLWLVIGYRLSLLVAWGLPFPPARSTLEEVGGLLAQRNSCWVNRITNMILVGPTGFLVGQRDTE